MKNVIEISVIGLGRVFNHYEYIFKRFRLKNYKLTSICDKDPIKAQYYSKKYKVPFFTDFNKLVKYNKPQLVLILTPSGFHYEHSLFFLKRGINVVTEKPITMIPWQGEKLFQISKKKKILFGAVFQNRYNPSLKYLKDLITKNRIGRITNFSVKVMWCRYQDYYQDGWHGTWKNDGGVINQQAIHHLDALNWLLGPVESVIAHKANILNKLEAEDTISILIKLKNGIVGTFQATTAARPKDIVAEISVYGKKGYAKVEGQALNKLGDVIIGDKSTPVKIKNKYFQKIKNGYGLGHGPFLQELFNRVKRKSTVSPVSVKDSINVTQIIHAIYESSKKKKWIKVNKGVVYKKLGKK
tara:strand:- start:292 stop:1356 length:1065 start_codon:yes stop_codon:yes gene_type:complete